MTERACLVTSRTDPTHTILVATTNPGKIRELRAMLGGDVQWKSLADFPEVREVKEDGATFAENARKKATGYAQATGLWTLADDSGLVVDALGGEPGVNSARFSGERSKGADRKLLDRRNMDKVLSLLKGVPADKRTARFVCCLCLASPQEVLLETQGTLEGLIIDKPAGTGGFGYDPIFYVPQIGKTVAQLGEEEKNAISHRGNALRKLRPLLDELLSAQQDQRS
ncbi:MAG: XTP/dITP diphosphatase [Planctomycetaceae bacterium]|nr:MAG: XTP/dITP diphosphatase [Planctomycetaceae bacterium]